ncbi:hypothetical protein K8P10_000375 [Leucobacter sp. Psy1]|uniref:glycosyltransferase family 4 protein n=1 Tax=Leucobacter sp. Psy1 TaxID=2875729 RepID=UPI001CD53255|nr:glycosyltransferase family 4 protein [Leucobacter sp. Psy1]UBH04864.1 hypothetical protein K8P10_000375 [Leucobacter sp. Psy1]
MSPQPEMIFHAPYRLNPEATSASGLRPVRMLRAFTELGYRVHQVVGTSSERAREIRRIRGAIARGEIRPEFVYSESSTMPAFMTDPDHLPRHPFVDAAFFRFCERRGIRVGLFYRDIYWRFPIYRESVRAPIAQAMRLLYRFELAAYRVAGLRLFLPSLEMGRWIPILPRTRMRALPPGGEIRDAATTATADRLRLLYVGGLGSNYQLHETVRAVSEVPDVELTICTRPAEWEQRSAEYGEFVGDRVRVVHRSGEELRELYAAADVCVLAVKPIVYWDFASPMKLYEYLGYGKPVLASEGTLAGRVVESEGIGWTVPYREDALRAVLERLSADRGEVERCAVRAREVRAEHSWEARARQAAVALTGSDASDR